MPKHLMHGLQARLQAGRALYLCQRLILQFPECIVALLRMCMLLVLVEGHRVACLRLTKAHEVSFRQRQGLRETICIHLPDAPLSLCTEDSGNACQMPSSI